MTVNVFEVAVRQKFRFPSTKGQLTAEQLWDLPLKAQNGFDLDSVARSIHQDLKAASEESFVAVTRNPANTELEQKLELVKQIIATRQAENAEKTQRAAIESERKRLLELRDKRKNQEMEELSKEEIEQRIKELSDQL